MIDVSRFNRKIEIFDFLSGAKVFKLRGEPPQAVVRDMMVGGLGECTGACRYSQNNGNLVIVVWLLIWPA